MSSPIDGLGIPRSAIATLAAFVFACLILGFVVGDDLPELHTVLDTAMFVLSGALALQLWDVGHRLGRPFKKHLSITFAATAILEFLHAAVSIEWSGPLAHIARISADLRPLTWSPPAVLLPLGIGAALFLLARGARRVVWFAAAITGAAAALFVLFQHISPYSAPDFLGVRRPSLIPVLLLWGAIVWACWRLRDADRAIPSVGLMAIAQLASSLLMLYSSFPPDPPAISAHLGRVAGYVAFLFSLMYMVSLDITERAQAEAKLTRLNEELDNRIREQTALLTAITDNTSAVIYVKNLAGRYLLINPRFAEIFQIDAAATIGKTDHDLFSKEAADAFRAMDERVARADRALTEEETAPHHDGVHSYISVKAPLKDQHGKTYAIFGISTDITDLKRAQHALAESEERAHLIVDSALDAVVGMNSDGVIIDWSPQATTTFGWLRDEAIGRPIADLIVPDRYRAHHRTGLTRYLTTGHANVLDRRIEISALHRDGHEFPVELSITAIRTGETVTFSGFARDITDRKTAEAKMRAQLERMALLDQVTRAIGERQDLDSIFQVTVRSVEDQLPADFVCLCRYDLAADALIVARIGAKSEALADALALTEQGRIAIDRNGLSRCVSGQLVYEADAGASTYPFPQRLAQAGLCSFVAAPLQVESQVFGALIVARRDRDGFASGECEFLRQLSEHTALASNQAQLTAALQQAYDDLRRSQEAVMQQERLRALGQMASGIAHDINNALSPIAIYIDSVLETDAALSQPSRAKLEIVQRAVEDAAHTVSRMKDFYRQREAPLALAPIQTEILFKQVLDLTRSRWKDIPQQKGIDVDVRIDLPDDAPPILGVESELREALVNLVFNAVDALPHGGVITLRARTANDDRSINVEVADNGVGMDEATRRRCLEPFFTTKGDAGTGLGLAMVYGVVQRHGGDLGIESAPGAGTTIRISLATADDKPAPAPPTPVIGPVKRLRILLIDDDPILLRSLKEAIGNEGHLVEAKGDGAAGVEAFETALAEDGAFDVVITDLGMPKMDGRRVAASIRALSPTTPIVLLTGWGEQLLVKGDVPEHVTRVLSKPPKLRELRVALAECSPPERLT